MIKKCVSTYGATSSPAVKRSSTAGRCVFFVRPSSYLYKNHHLLRLNGNQILFSSKKIGIL